VGKLAPHGKTGKVTTGYKSVWTSSGHNEEWWDSIRDDMQQLTVSSY